MRAKDTMTGVERIGRILRRQSVDRIGAYEHFWNDTKAAWTAQGKIGADEEYTDHFDYDLENSWSVNFTADLDFVPVTVEEDEDTITQRDGNGALLRRHKKHDTTPEHVDFLVKDRAAWEEHIKPKLVADERRVDFVSYRKARDRARRSDRFFTWGGANVFELMRPVCGHEHMLAGMALDPEWIMDMVDTFSRLLVEMQEMIFAVEGKPDGIWYYEDMGFKERPFMSPAMYRELIQPGHIRTIEYAKSLGLPVIMHSCGFVEPLLPYMVEAGIDCLQVIEVKAGMDLLRIHQNYGDRLSLMGGIDVRTLYSNDRAVIDRELDAKIPLVKQGFGYVIHSDHSIPATVEYENYRYFLERGIEMGRY